VSILKADWAFPVTSECDGIKENMRVCTGSLNMTGKSKRGKSMYKNKFSDFSVSAYFD